MTEVLSAVFRGATQLSLALLLGGAAFLLISRPHADPVIAAWRLWWRQIFPWVVFVNLSAATVVMLLQAATTAQLSVARLLADGEALEAFVWGTRYGRVGLLKLAVAALMLLPCVVAHRARSEQRITWSLVALLALAALTASIGPLAGHAAGDEQTRWLTPLHMLHIVAVCAWLGGLPLGISLVRRIGRSPDVARCAYVAQVRVRFSNLAMTCMAVIVLSGVLLGWGFIDTAGDLLGTRYGLLVCGKLVLLSGALAIANHVRQRFLPQVLSQTAEAGRNYPLAGRWVSMELALSVGILGLATLLSQTTPAIHDQPYWRFPFRISVEATWPAVPVAAVAAMAVLVSLLGTLVLALRWRRLSVSGRSLGVLAFAAAGCLALWKLSVPAYPDTYRRSTSSYLTVSIVQGKRHFEQYCTGCHGAGGLGDGVLAKTLPKPPANLSEPHTALHTAGDMFWWLTDGIRESGMPGFADVLDEQARWDVINFLRAFSQGFEARLLKPSIEAGRPWLGAPNFYFEDLDGTPRELKDYRENSNVLLVFPPPTHNAAAAGRLRDLAGSRDSLRSEKLEILVIDAGTRADAGRSLVQVQNGAEEIREAYDLFSRTVSNRGTGKKLGMGREHMEFLIDRFGYIRGRWIPEDRADGWNEASRLRQELVRLNGEPRLRPPPDDHVH